MAPKKRNQKEEQQSNSFAAALEFVKCCQMQTSEQSYQVHCRIRDNFVIGFDGILAAGFPVDEDISACPHTYKLAAALKRAKGSISVTKQENDSIVVKSSKFKAIVPSINPSSFLAAQPDEPVGIVNDRIKTGFALLNSGITIGGARVMDSALFLRPNTMAVTDGVIITQYWHGIDLPDKLIIPKQFVAAVCKYSLSLTHVGASSNSITFYFENGAWIKTQLYAEGWVDVDMILDQSPMQAQEVPEGFFTGVDALSDFGDTIYTDSDVITTHKDRTQGATYEVKGLTPGIGLSIRRLSLIKHIATHIDFVGTNNIMFFYGDHIRGAMAHMR